MSQRACARAFGPREAHVTTLWRAHRAQDFPRVVFREWSPAVPGDRGNVWVGRKRARAHLPHGDGDPPRAAGRHRGATGPRAWRSSKTVKMNGSQKTQWSQRTLCGVYLAMTPGWISAMDIRHAMAVDTRCAAPRATRDSIPRPPAREAWYAEVLSISGFSPCPRRAGEKTDVPCRRGRSSTTTRWSSSASCRTGPPRERRIARVRAATLRPPSHRTVSRSRQDEIVSP